MLQRPAEDHATVRELIVELAEVEDALRRAGGRGTLGPTEALAEREEEIVAALHQRGLPFHAQGAERA
ncbi:hypothetical protein [Sinomonas atrocyanea]